MLLPLFLLSSLLPLLLSFTLDTQAPYIVTTALSNSYFGYSVSLHSNDQGHYLIVGAPRSTQSGSAAGGIYKCRVPEDMGVPEECEPITAFTQEGNGFCSYDNIIFMSRPARCARVSYTQTEEARIQLEEKSDQWMGVTVHSDLRSEYLIGCAHRYESRYLEKPNLLMFPSGDELEHQLVGKCKLLDRTLTRVVNEYTPCQGLDRGYSYQGMCQFGISASSMNDTIIVGAPGFTSGSGTVYSYNVKNPKSSAPVQTETLGVGRSYVGYSSALCDMNGDGVMDYITGGPRGRERDYIGTVSIFQEQVTDSGDTELTRVEVEEPELQELLSGSQLGSYYGSSLVCGDLNGDGYDDLVVGEPWYSYNQGRDTIKPDIGRVHIYPGGPSFNDAGFSEFIDRIVLNQDTVVTLTGDEAGECFGYSLALAGDLNTDGILDIVIGSPHANDGQGKVTVYLGTASGLPQAPSQVITPTTLKTPWLEGFGWSLAGGKDMDGNGKGDVVIGCYKSQHVVLLRTLPMINVKVTLHIPEGLTELDPESEPNLAVPGSDTLLQGIQLQVCFEYLSSNTTITTSRVNYLLTLDSDQARPDSRLFTNHSDPAQTQAGFVQLDLEEGTTVCTSNIPAYFRPGVLKYSLYPVRIKVDANLDQSDPEFDNRAVLNQKYVQDATTTLHIKSDCPADSGICLTEIVIEAKPLQYEKQDRMPLVLGLVDEVRVPVLIRNLGPNSAYIPIFTVTGIPGVLPLLNRVDGCNSTYDADTAAGDARYTYSLICTLSAQFKPFLDIPILLEFDLTQLTGPRDIELYMSVVVSEPSIKVESQTGISAIALNVLNLAQVKLAGGSSQRTIRYNNNYGVGNKLLGYEGPLVRHLYEISLSHESVNRYVRDIDFAIYWPLKFPDGSWLFPLSEVEITGDRLDTGLPTGPRVYCDHEQYVTKNWELLYDAFKEPAQVYNNMSCVNDTAHCAKILCNIEFLERGASRVKIGLYTRVEEYFFHGFGQLTVESMAELLSVEDTMTLPRSRTTSIDTTLLPSTSKSQNLTWWIIVAVVLGLLFLILLILLLWRCKFFKRMRPKPGPPLITAVMVDEEFEMGNVNYKADSRLL